METNFNLGSLKIVQAPLTEYFKHASENVTNNLRLIRDEKKVPNSHESIDFLNKIQKTLEMIGLKGLSKVLSVTEEGLKAVRDVRFDSKKNIEILEISVRILGNSTTYIQRLVNSGVDQSKNFYSDYYNLSQLLNRDAQIKDLFFPKLDLISDVNEQIHNDLRSGIFINDNSKKNLILHLEKVHAIIQSKLPIIFNTLEANGHFQSDEDKSDYHEVCKQIYEAFDYAEKLKVNKSYFILFGIYKLYTCILSPIFNEKFVNYIQERNDIIKFNLSKFERVVARLIQNVREMELGEKTGNLRIDDEVTKEIIFELVYALGTNSKLKEMPVYKDLETYFDIEHFVEQLSDVEMSEESVSFSSDQIQEIEKDFLDLKEEFHTVSLKKEGSTDYHQHLSKLLGITKNIITSSASAKELNTLLVQIDLALEMVKAKALKFDETLQKEISLGLVLTEYGINTFIKNTVEKRLKKDFINQAELQASRIKAVCEGDFTTLSTLELPKLDNVSQKSDEKKTFVKIFEQLDADLIKIEETLDYFLKNNGENVSEIESIYKPLVAMKGLFAVLGKNDLGKVVNKISEPWKKVMEEGYDNVTKDELNESIVLVSGLSLLVRAFVSGNETAADELYGNLMKIFYQKNAGEVGSDSEVKEFSEIDNTEESIESVPTASEEHISFSFDVPVESSNELDSFTFTEVSNDIPAASDFNIYTESTSDPDIAEVFLMEADEVIQNLDVSFSALDKDISSIEEITNLRRYFHTLKGSGRMVGLEFMGEAGWMVEQTLARCLNDELIFDTPMLVAVKEMKTKFEEWVGSLKENNQVTVDLISVKKTFLALNPALSNHIDIPTVSEVAHSHTSHEDLSLDIPGDLHFVSEEVEFKFETPTEEIEAPIEVAEVDFNFEAPVEKSEISNESVEFKFDMPQGTDELSLESTEASSFNLESLENQEAMVFEVSTEEATFNFELPVEDSVLVEDVTATEESNVVASEHEEEFVFNVEDALNIEEEISVSSVEVNDSIMIEGQSVSLELYELFNQESHDRIEKLKEHIHAEYSEPVILDEEFMRHVHTISSIADSVNLSRISKISSKLESIAMFVIEREIALSQLQMNVIRHVVDNIDLFKETDSSKHVSFYDSLNEGLDNLHVELMKQEQPKVIEPVPVKEIAPSQNPNVDVDRLKEEFFKEVSTLVEEKNKELLKHIMENPDKDSKELVSRLLSKIDKFEEELEKIKEQQIERERLYNKALEVTKNDIRTLANIIKKKYEVANEELLEQADGEKVNELNLDPMASAVGSNDSPDVTEIMLSYAEEANNLINIVEETEFYIDVTKEDMEEISSMSSLNNSNHQTSPEDDAIIHLLNSHTILNSIFENKVSAVEDEIDEDIYDISKEEAEEMFDSVSKLIELITENGLSLEETQALKRYLHTFKGSVRMAGANKLGMLAHRLESLLDYVESRKLNISDFKVLLDREVRKIAFLLKSPNQLLTVQQMLWLDNILERSVNNLSIEEDHYEEVESDVVFAEHKSETTKHEGKRENKQFIRVLSHIVDNAINDASEIRLSRSSLEDATVNSKRSISELKTSSGKLLKMVKEVEVQAETQIQSHSSSLDVNDSNFDPLEFDRFTRLQELTRLMSEAVSDINETISTLTETAKVQDNTINTQTIVTNNLLSQLFKVRLVSVDAITERFYKIARNTAKELGKRVSLEIVGEKTEIDRLILDKIVSPIEHLLRNAIAHGIELPENRMLVGKPAIGKIKLQVSLEGNFTTIKIEDDGAGINVEKIKEIAIKKGLIKQTHDYSKDEIINLIFQSGFSTAETISQVAGRGVGMDVVRNEITSMGGTIKIESNKDQGSTFILTVPMEVATIQAMLCVVKDKLVAIPATLIEEVDSIKETEMAKAYTSGKVVSHGIDYPFYYAGNLLGVTDASYIAKAKPYNNVLRVKYMGESLVIHVDKVITTSEILIKSLGTIYSKISGILGVTVLGDGSQGIVINPVQLLEHYNKNLRNIEIKIDSDAESSDVVSKINVLVVDDSITVRRASSKMLERNNFNVILAKDGEDALEQLQVITPDIILSDIEMPKMDGFELVKNIRNNSKLQNVPIIMISSRTAEKHQAHAFQLGANDFLGKPYREEEILEKIQLAIHKMKITS